MNNTKYFVQSDLKHDDFSVEVEYKGERFLEVYLQSGKIMVAIHPPKAKHNVWELDHTELIEILDKARAKILSANSMSAGPDSQEPRY